MKPVAKLFLPPPDLSGCVLAGVYRTTVGAQLKAVDRFNHFPASPLVPVTLLLKGELQVVAAEGQAGRAGSLPRISVMAPQQVPVTSWAPAEIEAITLGIYPDAWRSLGGDPSYRSVPACLEMALDQFSQAQQVETGWSALCRALAPHWAECRSPSWSGLQGVTDWAKAMITRSALTGSGQSLRSAERRIKRLTGQTRRTLEFFSAIETLQSIVQKNSDVPLAEIAHLAGYADQSHMGRAVRRATGFSPARLNQAIQTEEAFWCYRLLGERF